MLSQGKNIARQKLEKTYGAHEYIDEVALMEKDGKLLAVVVPSTQASQKTEREDEGEPENVIKTAIEEQAQDLASYEKIEDFEVARWSLPRTSMGKIRRHKIESLYEDIQSAQGKEPEKELGTEERQLISESPAGDVWDWLKNKQFANRAVFMDADLKNDLGIDSLAQVDLTLSLEDRFGVNLKYSFQMRRLARISLQDILSALQKRCCRISRIDL